MNLNEICYENSCLQQVIIRLDFLEYINESGLFGPEVEKRVLEHFPKKGMRQLVRFQTVNVVAEDSGLKSEQMTHDGVQQEFMDSNGNKIILSNKYFALEINRYTRYEELTSVLEPILRLLFDKNQPTSTRTGIRYINMFSDDNIKPQKNFFIPRVGALLDTKQSDIGCIRSMAMNEYVIEDMHLNFRFGMYNPLYPQVMKEPNFVLDFDCFCDEAIGSLDELMRHINKGHDSIQALFETSITERLREVMKR